ncbi:hypothetical protein ALC53_08515 [Atta colombica]|uniref:Uncharacterized protein n=1 Tax=Atta colombica TaxID=520822 RepID=A0A195BAB7_9HYME|nr:hypothetical protein ALC53_08515 [Atta colombica]
MARLRYGCKCVKRISLRPCVQVRGPAFHRRLLSADSFGDYRMLLTIAYNDMIVLNFVVATLINDAAYR